MNRPKDLIFLGTLFIIAGMLNIVTLFKYVSMHVYRISTLQSIYIVVLVSVGIGIIFQKDWSRKLALFVLSIKALIALHSTVTTVRSGGGSVNSLESGLAQLTMFGLFAVTIYYFNKNATKQLFTKNITNHSS